MAFVGVLLCHFLSPISVIFVTDLTPSGSVLTHTANVFGSLGQEVAFWGHHATICLRSRGSDVVAMWDISLINQTANSPDTMLRTLVVVVMTIVASNPSGVIYR